MHERCIKARCVQLPWPQSGPVGHHVCAARLLAVVCTLRNHIVVACVPRNGRPSCVRCAIIGRHVCCIIASAHDQRPWWQCPCPLELCAPGPNEYAYARAHTYTYTHTNAVHQAFLQLVHAARWAQLANAQVLARSSHSQCVSVPTQIGYTH